MAASKFWEWLTGLSSASLTGAEEVYVNDSGASKKTTTADIAILAIISGDARYAAIAKGVTNGDSHNHSGGDGAQISYSGLSELPALGTAAAQAISDFEAAGAVATHAAVTSSVHGISAFGATLVDDADAATARGTLGLGTAATTAATDYATAAQGSTADSALQPGDDAADLGSGSATDGYVLTADGVGGAAWEVATGGGGSGDVAGDIHAATDKTTPVNADELGLVDSAASWVLKKLSWANLIVGVKSALSYFVDGSNVSIGSNLFANLTTGVGNVAAGSEALLSLTSGTYNFGFGYRSLRSVQDGDYNVAVGDSALRLNVSGDYNVGLGRSALYSTTGSNNMGIGYFALYYNAAGSGNVAIGYGAGRYYGSTSQVTGPSNSVFIGYNAKAGGATDSNAIVIGGQNPVGLGTNTTVIGTSGTAITRLFGNVATGVDAPAAAFHAIKTTEQLRLGYDATYYASFTVDSSGTLTQTAIGGQTFIGGTGVTSKVTVQGTSGNGTSTATAFEVKVGNNGGTNALYVRNDGNIYTTGPLENTTSGEGIVLKSPDGTRYKLTVANGGTLSITAA